VSCRSHSRPVLHHQPSNAAAPLFPETPGHGNRALTITSPVAYVLDVDTADNLWYFSTYPQLETLLMEEAQRLWALEHGR
jgi:hypothetical protein